jgi:hypothetical protein
MPLIVQAKLTIKPEGVATVQSVRLTSRVRLRVCMAADLVAMCVCDSAKLLEASKEYLTHPGCSGWDVMRNVKVCPSLRRTFGERDGSELELTLSRPWMWDAEPR